MAIFMLWLLREITNRLIARKIQNSRYEYEARKAVSYGAVFLGILILGRMWFEGFQSLTTIIGFASAGLAIALKDPLANIAGWFYLLWDDPFDVGHRIEIDGIKGDIVDQNICHFTVMEMGNWVQGDQSTGRMIHIPNSTVFTKPLHNYNDDFPYLWDEMQIRITFESDWKRAKSLIVSVLEKHVADMSKDAEKELKKASHKFMIFNTKKGLAPQTYVSVKEWGIQISAHYIVDFSKRRTVNTAVWEDILDSFDREEGIRFAYPALHVHGKQFGAQLPA